MGDVNFNAESFAGLLDKEMADYMIEADVDEMKLAEIVYVIHEAVKKYTQPIEIEGGLGRWQTLSSQRSREE